MDNEPIGKEQHLHPFEECVSNTSVVRKDDDDTICDSSESTEVSHRL